MRKTLAVLALLLAGICAPGCIYVHTETEYASESPDTTTAEIDAIGKLSFERSRESGYKRIAQRSNLSDAIQVRLVNVATSRLSFERSRVKVLLTLIENPCFSAAGKAAVLERLQRLSFERSKVKVLEAISAKRVKPAEEAGPPAA